MKTIKIALLGMFTLIGVAGMAQNKMSQIDKTAKLDSMLIIKLQLTDAEQKSFLPVYHKYMADKKANRASFKPQKGKERKKMEDLTDEEMETLIQKRFKFAQTELDLKKSYHEKFKKVLPMKKIAKLYHIEKKLHPRGRRDRKRSNRKYRK